MTQELPEGTVTVHSRGRGPVRDGGDPGGRIAARAEGGEILAANVVRELAVGKGFLFSDRGDVVLRGFEDPVRLYEVRWMER
jgi:hypothetical protein